MSRKNFSALIVLLVCALVTSIAQAGNGVPALMPFQARVTNSGGNPVTWPVNVLIRVYPPAGACYVYEENFGLITPNPFGIFTVVLGAGTPSGPANTLAGSFNNDVASVLESCGGNYNPGPQDWRRLEIVVDGVPLGAMQTIGSAGFAINSQLLSGHPMTDFIQTSTNITQANVEKLTDGSEVGTMHLHDGRYAQLGASNSFSGNITSSGNIYASGAASSMGIGTTTPAADLEIKKLNPTIQLTSNGAGSPALNFFGGATQRGRIEAASGTNGLKLYSGGTLGITLDATANAIFGASVRVAGTTGLGQYTAANEPALLVALAGGGATNIGAMWVNTTTNEIKYWNGAAAITVGDKNSVVNSVSAGNGVTIGGTATNPTVSVNYGSAANTAIQGNASFGGDVSGGYTAISVDKIKGKAVDMSTAPSNGEVLKWNGSAWAPGTDSSTDSTKVAKAGDTMTGLLVLSGDPSNAVGAATKQYVDAVTTAAAGAYVRKDGTSAISDWDVNGATAGGTVLITGVANPSAADGVANKSYVDTAAANATDNTKLPKAGGTMTGNIAMGTNSITGMADPSGAQDAATKNYVDTKFVSKTLPAAPVVGNNGQSIRWNNGGNTWEYFTPSSGSVNSVSGTAGQISNTGTATDPVLALVATGVTAGSYGSATQVPRVGVDAKGRVTDVALITIDDSTKLPKAGGTMTGNIAMGTNSITGMADPSGAQDAATKNYVDTKLVSKNLATPAVGQNGQSIRWNNGTPGWEYFTPNSGDALTTNPLSQFAATTSAQLRGVLSDESGTGAAIFGTSPTITSPTITTPTISTGYSVTGSTSGTVTINAAAVTTNGTYTWPAAIPGANRLLQSDSSGNLTWVAAATGDALVANPLSQFAATTSAQLAGVISNETGSGALVFGTSPTLTTPTIGTGLSVTGSTSGTLTINAAAVTTNGTYTWPAAIPGANRILQSDSSGNLTWVTASVGDALVANPLSQFAATTSAQLRGVLSDETGTGAAVFATSPTLGTGVSITGSTSGTLTINAAATTTTGTYTWPAAIPGANRILQSDSSGVLTWVAASTGDALVANPLSQFAATTSAQLRGVLSDESGTGAALFGTSPTITTPTIGTGLSVTGSTSGTVTINAAAVTTNGTYTWPAAIPGANRFLQSDSSGNLTWQTAGAGDALTSNPLSQFAATTSAQLAGVLSNETGSGAAVFGTSPTLTTPTFGTGYSMTGSTSGTATINAAAVTTNGTYTWPAAIPGANRILQSDSSGNLTWVAASTGDALVANPLSQFAATTSAQLRGVLSDETGTGAAVFATSPTLGTGLSVTGSTSGTLTINAAAVTTNGTYTWPAAIPGANRILQSDSSGNLTWVTAATGDALVANPLSQFAATTSAQLAGVISNETGSGALVFGTSPTLATPTFGTGFAMTGSTSGTATINAAAVTTNGTYTWPAAIPGANRILQSDSSGNLTWVTAATGDALVANPLSQFAATTSAQLRGVLSDESGTGAAIFGTSPTLTTPTFGTGFAMTGSTSGTATINAAAVTTNGTYTWPAAIPGANRILQSDSSGNLTWVAASTGDALVANPLSQFAATTSAQLRGVLSDETGTGAAVFATSPTLGTGVSITGSTSGTLTINAAATTTNGTYTWPAAIPGANRLLQSDSSGNLTWVAAATGDALVANPLSQFAATTSAQLAGVISNETGSGALVFGTSPTLATPTFGTGYSMTGSTSGTATINAAAVTTNGTYTWPAAIPGANRILQSDSSGNLTWVSDANSGGDALVANPLSQFAATTSAQLRGVLSDESGTGAAVFATSPTLSSPTLTTPTIGTGLSVTGSTSGTVTINAAAVTTNGTYTWPAAIPGGNRVLQTDNTGALSWISIGGGGDAFVANPLSQFAATTSAQLAGVLSNETGSGAAVFGTSPTLTTPTIGTGLSVTGSTSGTLTINAAAVTTNGTYTWPSAIPGANRILQSDSSGNLTWVAASTGDALVANPLSQFAATTSAQLAGVISNETGSGALVFGTSPTLTTPSFATGFAMNGSTSGTATINAAAVTTNGTYTWPSAIPGSNRILQSDSSGNLTWVAAATGDALVANPLSQFAATTSAQLAGVISNETGSGALVFGTSPTLTTPSFATGFAMNGSTSGTATINAAAVTTNGTYTWPSAIPGSNRILQSDSSGNLTWVAAATGDALVANPLSQFAATTSAQLRGVLSDETGTGAAVFATSPTLGTGVSITGSTSGTLTINAAATTTNGTYTWPSAIPGGNRLLQSDNTGALSWVAAATGDALVANPLSQFAATTSAQLAGVISNETGSGALVFGTSPTLATPTFGTGFAMTGSTSGTATINAAAVTTNGTYTWPAAIPGSNRILQSDSSGNLTWVTAATGDALVANPLSQFAATTSAQLAGVISNETGSGALVFGTSPTLATPTFGTGYSMTGSTSGTATINAAAVTTNGTYTWPAAIPGANRLLQSDSSGNLTWVAAATGDALVANPLSQFAATTSAQLRGVLSDETGTGAAVFATSPTLGTGWSVTGSTSGTLTINAAATTTTGTYTWPSAIPGANRLLQSDSSGNLTWVAAATGDALVANPLSQFASTTSAQLAGVLSNETGSGAAVFGTSPTIATPTFGTGFSVTGSTSGTATINAAAVTTNGTYIWPAAIPGSNKFLQSDSSGNLTWQSAGAGDAVTTNPLSQFAATTSAQLAGVISNETGSGALVFGTSPTLTTPAFGTGFSMNGSTSGTATINAAAVTTNGTYTWPAAIPGANRILQSDSSGNLTWVAAATGDALVANPLSQFAATTSAQLRGVLSDETGTGAAVFATSPTLGTGVSITGSTSGTLTINAAATTTTGTYTWPAAIPGGNRLLQSDNAGNLTWIAAGGGGDAFTTNPLSQFAATTSAQLAGVISNETGSGALVFGTSPTLATPTFGTGFAMTGSTSGTATINAAAVTTNGTYTWPAAIPGANRILQSDSSGNLTWVAAATGDALVANPLSQFAATTSAQLRGVLSDETGTGAAVFATSPTLGTGWSVTGSTSGTLTINAAATTTTGTYTWPSAIPGSNRILQSDNTGALSWVAAATGDALVANPLSQFASTTSAQLAGVLSNETGSGAAVFGTSPTLTTPTFGTGYSMTGSTSGTATINAAAVTTNGTYIWPAAIPGSNKFLQSDSSGNLTWQSAGAGDAVTTNPLSQFAATTSAQLRGVLSDESGTGAAIFGTSPTLTTPTFGTGFAMTGSTSGTATINAAAVTTNGTYTWPAAIPGANRILQSDSSGNLTWVTAATGDALVANPLSQFASTTSAQLAGVISNETGSGAVVFGTSPTLTTPTFGTGWSATGSTSGTVTINAAAVTTNGTYIWPNAIPGSNKFLQSDSSGNLTWQSAGAGDAVTTNPLSQFAATTSAQLAGVISNETGSGALVFGTSPTLGTPTFGTGFSMTGSTSGTATINAAAVTTNGTYTWPNAIPGGNRILQSDNTGALTWVTAATGDALVANPLSQFASTTSAQLAGVLSNETGSGAVVFGTSPTLTTPTFGTGWSATGSTSGTVTINAAAVTTNGTYTWPNAIPGANRLLQSDSSGNLTWVTAATGDAVVANPLSQFASTTSAQLAGVISNETGSGALVFATSPTLGTGLSISGSTSGTLTINAAAVTTNGTYTWPNAIPGGNRILQTDNTGALSWVTAATGDALVSGKLSQFASTTSAELAGVISNETGSGVLVYNTSPTLGTGLSITGSTSGTLTINAAATTTTGTYTWPSAIPGANRLLQSDSSGNLTWVTETGNATTSGDLSQFAATTSAQLRGVLSDETGSGAAVFGTSPTITTPSFGTGFTINGSTSGATTINAAATTTTGTYIWPSALPGANRLLQSDSSGNLTWVAASGTGDYKADGTVNMTGNIKLNGNWLSNDGGSEGVWVNTSGAVGIQTSTITAGMALEVNGTVRATNLLLTSDRRAKKDIRTFDSAEALAKILMVRPVNFVWRNDDSEDSGVIAQELEEIFPYMVHDVGDGSTLSVKYTSLISPLIGSVQELNKKNEALEKENAELKERLANIERDTASVKDELKEIKELLKSQKGK